MTRYIIIGGGVAGASCIEGIRSVDPEGKITLISEEDRETYCRPLISYYLEKKTDPERMKYRDPGFWECMGAEILYGRKAAGILPDLKEVELEDGTRLPYDRLCLATGSRPFVPPMEGLETVEKKHTFMTMDDALALEEDLAEDARVLIIGAGLIGLKCAEGILSRVGSITVCDLADRVLSSILDAEGAGIIEKHLRGKGIRFLLGDSVKRFEGSTAYFNSGEQVGFDVLVLAVGVRANTGLFKDIGGNVGRGIVIDSRMQTSFPDIYAAGDCTETVDVSSGLTKVMAIMPNAVIEGFHAGVNMAGGSSDYDRLIPMNSIGFFGLHAMTAGTYEGELYEEKTEGSLKRLFIKDDLLKGFILIGGEERAGIYTSMIREKTSISTIDLEVLKKTATTFAFSQRQRGKMFGGVV